MNHTKNRNRTHIAARIGAVLAAVVIVVSAPVSASANTWYKLYDHTYPTLQECNRFAFKDTELGYKVFVSCSKGPSGWTYHSTRPW